MASQNSINTGYLATSAEIIAQSDPRAIVAPGPLGVALNMMRNECPGRYENLSMSLSAGVLSFIGFNGSAISTTNPAYVNLPSKVFPGRGVRHQLPVGNASFNEASLTGSLFGTTNVVAWGSPMPFYVYLVANDADAIPVYAISRVPHLMVSPSVANSGQYLGTTAASEQSFWYLDNTISLGDYDGNPCASLGSFRATKSGANIWTLSLTSEDGFGQFNEATRWEFPTNQSGAPVGKYLLNNGGTAPTFTSTPRYNYSIKRSGLIDITCFISNTVGGVAGVGAVAAQISMPFRLVNGDLCVCRIVGAPVVYATPIPSGSSPFAVFNDITAPGTSSLNLVDFSTVLRIISFGLTTQIPIL